MTQDFSRFATEEVLRDGGSIHVRAIRPDDKERLVEHFQRLSTRAIYFRFFGSKKRLSAEELRTFTEVDFKRHVGLVATLTEAGEERIIGVGRYISTGNESSRRRRAEVAFAVADEHQGRGIGTLLLQHLARIARANGIAEFEADVLGENNQMLEVFGMSGFVVKRSVDYGVVHVSFPTEETEAVAEASLSRAMHAVAQGLRQFFEARSVAVVGASRQAGTIGNALVMNLRRHGFTGAVYPVNPKAGEIAGFRCFPSVASIGALVDLAVIAVPAAAVEAAVRDCAAAGVRGVVVISSGFAEVSEAGRELQRKLTELVRRSGMRMIGPNCMGILNADPAISLNATFAPTWPPAGNIGMLTQSGALGLAILEAARHRKIGISTFVSVGNKADVSGNDLLAYWADDPRTQVIVLYLESFGNPRKFARIAPQIARRKPIVAVKSGRSAAGTRAASSHSAALASLDVAVDALFEQAGVIRTDTLEELFDIVTLLSTQPLPAGPRVGVVTNAGGPGVLLADTCEAHGLKLPELTPATLDTLRSFLPRQAGLTNPVDMLASASAEDYAKTIAAVGADPSVDSLIAIYIPPLVTQPEDIARAIARGASEVAAEKPILSVFLTPEGAPPALDEGPRGRIPCYEFPENAALALAAAEEHGRWRRRPEGHVLSLDRFAEATIRAVIERVLAGCGKIPDRAGQSSAEHETRGTTTNTLAVFGGVPRGSGEGDRQPGDGSEFSRSLLGSCSGPCWLEPRDLATVLRAAGIEFAAAEQTSVEDAAATAERLGYPLVAKAISPGLVHKSDVGGVILGLESAEDVSAAVASLAERMAKLGARLDGVLLQREVHGGIEALVGVTVDPTFGPLLVCGLGGVLVELLRDVSFRLTPVTDVDAQEMIEKLRARALLDGYRGAPPGDRDALVSVIRRISALVEIVPELRELDLNPVKVLAPGRGAVVVDGRMRIGPAPGP